MQFIILSTACCQLVTQQNHSFKGSPVIEYTQDTLPTQTGIGLGSHKLKKDFFIMFYAGWCPHCQKFLPTWIEFKQNHPTDAIAAVHCPDNNALCQQFSVKTFPTLLLFSKDQDKFCKFEGQRSTRAIEEYWDKKCSDETMIQIPEEVENKEKLGDTNGQEGGDSIGNDGIVKKGDERYETSKEKLIEVGVAQQQLGKKIK